VVIFAWVYEITPEGLSKSRMDSRSATGTLGLLALAMVVVVVAIGVTLLEN